MIGAAGYVSNGRGYKVMPRARRLPIKYTG